MFFLAKVPDFWSQSTQWTRGERVPVIAFEGPNLHYQVGENGGPVVSVPIAEVTGIEFLSLNPRTRDERVRIQRWATPTDEIDISCLSLTSDELFAVFMERMPHRIRLDPDRYELVAPRYAPKALRARRPQ